MRIYTLLLVLLPGLLLAADAKDDAIKEDHKKHEGTWMLVSEVRDGKTLDPDKLKQCKRVIKGTQATLTMPHVAKESWVTSRTIDPTQKPKTVDFKREKGAPDAGKVHLGIYEIDIDTSRVCFAPPGKPRPTEFSAKEGSGHTLHVWKRAKE